MSSRNRITARKTTTCRRSTYKPLKVEIDEAEENLELVTRTKTAAKKATDVHYKQINTDAKEENNISREEVFEEKDIKNAQEEVKENTTRVTRSKATKLKIKAEEKEKEEEDNEPSPKRNRSSKAKRGIATKSAGPRSAYKPLKVVIDEAEENLELVSRSKTAVKKATY